MAYQKKNWLSVGESGANDSNSVLNKDNMNDLEKRIKDTFKSMDTVFSSNTESNYIKFADGTLIQYGFYETGEIQSKVLTSYTVKFPVAFKDNNYIILPVKLTGGARGFGSVMESVSRARNPDNCNINAWNFDSTATESLSMGWLAIGRWK